MHEKSLSRVLGAALVGIGCALSGAPRAFADDLLGTYSTTVWSHDDGLPSTRVFSITQDAIGYLWLGTGAGLVRFDGVRFERWDRLGKPSLGDLAVNVVYHARNGSLWIGFHGGGGVSRIQQEQVEHFHDP